MSETDDDSENNSDIKQTVCYGIIPYKCKFWDDSKDIGEDILMKSKLIKIKIFSGEYKEHKTILGIEVTYRHLFTNKIKNIRHIIKSDYIDVKEIETKQGEFITDFHIRFDNNCDFLYKLGFGTNLKNQISIGYEEGENKKIETNGGQNFIIGTYGCFNERLTAIGFYYMKKTDFFKNMSYSYLMLRYLIKKDETFKEKWNKDYKQLPIEYQYIWKTIILPDSLLYSIFKYIIY